MTAMTVTATRWRGGWELADGDDTLTQVASLDRAEQQVRDYLDTVEPDQDHSTIEIIVMPDIGSYGAAVEQAKAATRAAKDATIAAAEMTRETIDALREGGYSLADCAGIFGISRGRISQIIG